MERNLTVWVKIEKLSNPKGKDSWRPSSGLHFFYEFIQISHMDYSYYLFLLSCFFLFIYIYIYIPKYMYIYIYIHIYINPPYEQDVTKSEFFAVLNRFDFKIFCLLDRLPYQS